MPSEEITQSQEYHKVTNEEVSTNDTSIINNEATSSDSQGNASQLEEFDMTNTSTAQVQEPNTVPAVGQQDTSDDSQKPEKSLEKRTAAVINRLTNVDTVKTGKGLRKLKNDAKSIIGEIDVEVSLEQKAAQGGDVVEVLASGQAIANWEGKLEKINDGFNSINSRAEYLSNDS